MKGIKKRKKFDKVVGKGRTKTKEKNAAECFDVKRCFEKQHYRLLQVKY